MFHYLEVARGPLLEQRHRVLSLGDRAWLYGFRLAAGLFVMRNYRARVPYWSVGEATNGNL